MLVSCLFLSFCIIALCNDDGDWLKCKPKPGCSIARCDPRPGQWLQSDGEPDEYSILCPAKKAVSSPEVSGSIENSEKLGEDLLKLKGRLERNEDDFTDMKFEITKLRTENLEFKNQMEIERKRNKDMIKNALEPVKGLQARVEYLEGLTKDMNGRPTTSQSFVTKTQKTVTSSTATKPTAAAGSCDIAFNRTCYWTHIQKNRNVNFARAEEICSNNASIPAYFPNEKVYNSVAEDVRSKIPTGRSYVDVWTGVTIDTNTGDVTHPSEDTYVKWYPGWPRTGSSYETRTHVVLGVRSDPDDINQGMRNRNPQWDYLGLVCQTTIE